MSIAKLMLCPFVDHIQCLTGVVGFFVCSNSFHDARHRCKCAVMWWSDGVRLHIVRVERAYKLGTLGTLPVTATSIKLKICIMYSHAKRVHTHETNQLSFCSVLYMMYFSLFAAYCCFVIGTLW